MPKVKIVTDSTACLSPELVTEHGISVVPLKVVFGKESYSDGVDITNEEFYQKLVQTKSAPSAMQPSTADFIRTYEKLTQDGHPVLSIHISGRLSDTIESALGARKSVIGEIEVVDSLSAAMGLGMMVLAGARCAAEGHSLSQVRDATETLVGRMNLLFAVDSPEYLHRGGLIGGAASMVDGLLHFKPIVSVKEGRLEPLSRVRTKRRAIEHLMELMVSRVPKDAPVHAAILHAQAFDDAVVLEQQVRGVFYCREVHLSEVGPALATHVGPGAVGLAFYYDRGTVPARAHEVLQPNTLTSLA